MPEKLLSYEEVGRRLGFGRTQVFEMVRAGRFPEPLRIGRSRRWRESTVDEWIAALAERSERKQPGAPA